MDAAVKKSLCYFLLLFLALPGITVLVTLLILHPQKPIFSIQTVKVESYKLQVKSDKEIFLSSLLSLNLTALNPNKVGISYDTSRLHILDQADDDGITVGMLRVPRFHQPPKSKDINVAAQVIFGCVNLSKILSGNLLLQQQQQQEDNANTNKISLSQSQFRILGDVKAQVHLFHLPLPKFKVFLGCDIKIDGKYLTSLSIAKNQMISLPPSNSNSILLFKRCSVALYL